MIIEPLEINIPAHDGLSFDPEVSEPDIAGVILFTAKKPTVSHVMNDLQKVVIRNHLCRDDISTDDTEK